MSRADATVLEFSVDVSSIPRVRGCSEDGTTLSNRVAVKVVANALHSAYVEVQLPVINGVTYHYGRLWAVIEGGAWQLDAYARPKLSSPWGRVLDEPTASAARTFTQIAELVLSKLATLDGLAAALQAAAVEQAKMMQERALRDLSQLEKRMAEVHAQVQLAEDTLTALREPLTPEQHRFLVSFLDAGHSYGDAVEAAKVLA